MTRKDYELIAGSIRRFSKIYREEAENQENDLEILANMRGGLRALTLSANSLASDLSKTNPRFDGKKFLEACGVEHDKAFLVF